MRIVPDAPLREDNDCHEPAGSPIGGRFCSKTGRGDLSLARPFALLGLDSMHVSQEAVSQWLEREGREFQARPLPAPYTPMTPQQCYQNATKLVMESQMSGVSQPLQYAEGIVTMPGTPFGILHAWAVTADGEVVDPTLRDTKGHRYFGVVYPYKAYAAHIVKSGTYGVLGGDDKAAAAFLKSKGIEPLQRNRMFDDLMQQMQQMQKKQST